MLTSLDQNGGRSGSGTAIFPDADVAPSVERRGLSHLSRYLCGTWQARLSPQECGNRTARQGDRQAGMGSRRRRKPCGNSADRGSEFAPARKGADFREVFRHEKVRERHGNGNSQIGSRHGSCWREPGPPQETHAAYGRIS